MKTKFTKEDDYQKYFVEKPEPGFSPERNKAIVQNSIKKHNAMMRKKKKDVIDQYFERTAAVVDYLRYADKKPGYRLDRYFDMKYIAFLRGDDIKRELYARAKIYNNKGELITF